MRVKSFIALAALLITNMSVASNIELHDNCESKRDRITNQDEVDQIIDCLYINRKNSKINREPALRQLSPVASTFIINIDRLREALPKAKNSSLNLLYLTIVSKQNNATSGSQITGERRNKKAEREAKYHIALENINKKYSYHDLERLRKHDPAKYIDTYENKLTELETLLTQIIGGNDEVGLKSTFRDGYRRLGDYAVHVAGEPEKGIDFYLKEVEYKVVPRKLPDNLSESQKKRLQKDAREAMKALRAMGAIGDKPNTPCYKIYELLGNNISRRHRAYPACRDELKKFGIHLFSIFDRENDNFALEPSVLKVKVRLTGGTDRVPVRHASKILIESAYRDLDEHFCNELQLVDTNNKGEAIITVRKNRFIRATILDRAWSNNKSEESMRLSTISTHKNSTRFNEIVLHVNSDQEDGYDKKGKRRLLGEISYSLKDCRDHGLASQTIGGVDKLLYVSTDYRITNPHTTMAKEIGFLSNAVLSNYYDEIAYPDELKLFRHGALHRLALAQEQYNKADLYNLEMGLLLDSPEPLVRFIEKYGTSAINSYFGDECSFTSYILSIYSYRKSVNREIENVLMLYEGGRYSHMPRDKLKSNKTRYENAKSSYEKMEGFRSDVAALSVINNLAFSEQQQKSSCNKTFIDEFLREVARNNDVGAIRLAVRLGVNPNYEMNYGGPYITVMSRSQDIVVELLRLGADPMIKGAGGTPLFTISLNQKYKKIISYYIKHDLIIGSGIRNYAKLFAIDMDDFEDTRKLLSHLVSANESFADEIVQAAAVTGRVDILEVMFNSGVKVKKSYDSPIAGRHNAVTHSLDGSHKEFLILNAARGKLSDNTLKAVDILVRNGADVNSHSQGVTAITYAVRFGDYKLISKLIELGAKISFVPKDGTPALLSASKRGLSYSNGCFPHIPIIAAAVKEYLESNEYASDREEYEKCIIFMRDKITTERTESEYRIVELLIGNHAEVNVKSSFGRTPLMLYALKGDKRVVNLLLENGADPDIKDVYGKTYHDFRKAPAPKLTVPSATGRAYLQGGGVVTVPVEDE